MRRTAGPPTASTTFGPGHLPANLINGDTAGVHWGNGGGWADATAGAFPDRVQIDFAGQKTIDHDVLYSGAGQFGGPVRADRHDDLQPMGRYRLHGAGLERNRMDDARDGHGTIW